MRELRIDTPAGAAAVALDRPRRARAMLVLGHGAGGGVDARDLRAVRTAASAAGYAVARVTQPYRLAGRRTPAPPAQLDAAFTAVVARLGRLPMVVGGRSSGARVACRTAADVGACGVLALSFPLHPPGRPEKSRIGELQDVPVPVLVLQGERDPFGDVGEIRAAGVPDSVVLRPVPGADHGFAVRRGDPPVIDDIAATCVAWLDCLFPPI